MSADSTFLQIETAAHGGAFGNNPIPAPTEAQCLSGNYKVGRASIYGLAIAIEQPRGSYRTGIDSKTGKRWASRMAAHYGYINGTKGNDGDCVDCFIGFYPQSQAAFVINQNVGGKFDEHKVMLAYPDEESARRAYLDSYERGWNGLASVVSLSVSQLKWWLKNGDMRRPLRAENLPHEGLETMTRKVQWNSEALPYDQTLDQVLYEIRRSDAGESLLLDAVSAKDIIEDADGALAFDALVTPYAKLERKMEVLQGVMVRSGESVKPVAMQVTEPFKQRGVANVAAIFELSDGQTVSIFFHNPDVTPNKMAASDEVISWKWLLNKKDITIVVAPERGEDLNVREVARRIIRLAEKNSPAFQRANTKRAERMQGIQALKDEITTLETELATAQHELEVAKVAAETAPVRTLLTDEEQAALAKREEAARAILEGMTEEQITQVGASPSLVTVVTLKLGRFSAIDKILENHPDDVEKAIASVVTEASTKSAQQKADITYRNSADGLFTSFFPDTPEGEKAWNIINATPGAEGGKVLAAHAEPTIEQLRKAGYTVEEDTSAPSAVDDDALLAELAQKSGEQDGSPDVFSVGSVKFQAFAVKIRQGKQRVWGVRVLENGKEMNPADGNGAGFKSDTKASMIEDMERSYAAITKIGDKEQNENRWREGFGLPPLPTEGASASNEQALIDAYIKAWGEEAAMVNAAVAAVNWEGIIDNASATAEIQKLQSAANSDRPIIKARDALEAAGMKTWDSRLSGVTETEEFRAQSKAMDAYREAMDKIQAIAKEKLIEAGKAELSALPEDAPLEDAARAIYRKHGIDMGQRSDWVSRVVTAVKEKDAEALRSILAGVGSDSNKASMEIFERAAGFKLAKTQKERAKQIDEWAGITTEKRAEIEAAKDAAWQARKLEEGVKDAWGWLKNMNVRDGADIVDGQQYLLRQFNDGYDEAGTSKKGAATIYGMKKGSGLRFVNNRSFNAFLKSAMAFGGLRKALESVGAIEPVGNADGDKAVSVDAAYQFASATDEFKAWLADYLDKPEYSPFVTAKEMDQAAQRNGASVDWGIFSGAALDGVGAAVAELERALDVVATNEPINRAEGNIDQANLEAEVSGSIKEAIGILSEADYGPSEEEIGGLFEAESATLDSADGAYLGVEKQAISATKALLQYFRDFIASDAKFAKVPESAYGWTAAGEIMDKDEAKRRLRSLIDIAINRKAGIPDLTPEQDKRLADYAHDARTISDYLTKRIRHTGARNLLRTPEMKAKYPHIDNQPRDGFDSVSLDGIDSDGYVGKVKKGGEVVGRIDIGGDGKAMVFVGASGDQRVVFPSGTEATYSDEDAAAMIDALFSTKAANAAPEAIEGPAKDRASALKMLTDTGMNVWMSEGQNKAVIAGLMGEEWQFFADKMKELAGVIAAMPKTYDQDGMGDSAVAHLHYFRGAADWYITEKDMEGKGTQQAFGLADLGYGGELGYISIEELISAGVELDFHFSPKTIGQIKGKGEPATQEAAPEVSPEDRQKQVDQALFQSVIDGNVPDILAPELADSLEAAYYRQQTDPALVSLFEQAVSAYQNAMMSATAELA
jgi:hypothetical protein